MSLCNGVGCYIDAFQLEVHFLSYYIDVYVFGISFVRFASIIHTNVADANLVQFHIISWLDPGNPCKYLKVTKQFLMSRLTESVWLCFRETSSAQLKSPKIIIGNF